MHRNLVLIPLLLLIPACALKRRSRDAKTQLERALTFVEQRRSGAERDLHEAGKVPLEGAVDVHSTILVKIDRDALLTQFRGPGVRVSEPAGAVQDRKAKVVEALDLFGTYLGATEVAVEAFSALRLARAGGASVAQLQQQFLAARSASSDAEGAFLDRLAAMWPEGSPEELRIKEILEANSRDMTGMREFLQQQIDRLDADFAAAQAQGEARRVMLRLEAVLARGDGTQVGVHLDGYDDLDAGRVRAFDRTGLALDAAQLAELQEMMRATSELSDAANRVLRKQQTLQQAFSGLQSGAARALGERVVQFEALAQRLETGALQRRWTDARQKFDALGDELAAIARGAVAALEAKARALPGELLLRLQGTDAAPLQQVLGFVVEAKALADAWAVLRPETLPELLVRTAGLARQIRSRLGRIQPVLDALGKEAEDFASTLAADLGQLGEDKIAEAIAAWNASAAREVLLGVVGDVRELAAILQFLRDLAQVSDTPPPSAPIRVPEARPVPLDKIEDTYLSLPRTTRRPDDLIELRGTVLQDRGGVETELSDAKVSFEIERLGWHADLVPSVNLVTPDTIRTGSDRFGFAPSLAWMHTYRPYPEDKDFGLRLLRPAVGVHATFLNFDPDRELEVGLGATVSLFDGVLMGGVGYNLMAEDEGDGDVYFFFGSSLIPLLQATGFSNGGGLEDR